MSDLRLKYLIKTSTKTKLFKNFKNYYCKTVNKIKLSLTFSVFF